MAQRAAVDETIRIRDIPSVVAARLREQIMSGELLPGSRLREVEIAKRFGVSRGPVRDALRELSHQGLVVTLPRRGSVVWQMSLNDIEEVYELREALESLALRRASRRASDEELKAIRRNLEAIDRAIKKKDSAAQIAADLEFHRAVCRAAGNGRLLSMWEELATQSAVLIGITMVLDDSLLRGLGGHHQLVLEALIKRDPEKAGEILTDHFEISRKKMAKAMAASQRTGSERRARQRKRRTS